MKVPLQDRTLREIHEAIQGSKSLNKASSLFGVSGRILAAHLGRFACHGNILSYQKLKSLNTEDAIALFTDEKYNQKLDEKLVSYKNRTLYDIHQAIRNTDSYIKAAFFLGTTPETLRQHLGKYYCHHERLSYEKLKDLSTEDAMRLFTVTQYHQVLTEEIPPLEKQTLYDIHQAIRNTNTLSAAAFSLGKRSEALQIHLGRFYCNHRALSYEALKALSTEDASRLFTDKKYHQVLTEKVSFEKRSLYEIHQAIRNTSLLSHAAFSLGVQVSVLEIHLHRFMCHGQSLSYRQLKDLSTEDAIALFTSKKYHQALTENSVSFEKRTLCEIHLTIREKKTISHAAHSLGVQTKQLTAHLNRFVCNGHKMSYWLLKDLDQEQAIARFTYEKYHRPLTEEAISQDFLQEDEFEWGDGLPGGYDDIDSLNNTPSPYAFASLFSAAPTSSHKKKRKQTPENINDKNSHPRNASPTFFKATGDLNDIFNLPDHWTEVDQPF